MRGLGFTSVLLASMLNTASTFAKPECECLWEGSFNEVQANTDLVVSGTVLGGKGNSIDLKIDRSLRGDKTHSEIRIWLKTADYCRPEPKIFPENSQWVMALNEITEIIPGGFNPSTPNVSFGRIGDYSLSSCGGYWLNQSENLVTGNLVNAPRWVREPKMTPVLVDLLAQYIVGDIGVDALITASTEDPALRELMLDTKAFLRAED